MPDIKETMLEKVKRAEAENEPVQIAVIKVDYIDVADGIVLYRVHTAYGDEPNRIHKSLAFHWQDAVRVAMVSHLEQEHGVKPGTYGSKLREREQE